MLRIPLKLERREARRTAQSDLKARVRRGPFGRPIARRLAIHFSSHKSDLQNEEEAVEKPDWKEKPIFVRNV